MIADESKLEVDSKTRLQNWCLARKQPPPEYAMRNKEGTEHNPNFIVIAKLKSGETAMAEGGSKKQAEFRAAKMLLSIVAPGDG